MEIRQSIEIDDEGNYSVLRCPHCGGEYLHHNSVAVFERPEDGETVLCTFAGDGEAKTCILPNDVSGNPSYRRHGLAIRFRCENCEQESGALELTISQHKGQTIIAWRKAQE